MAIPDSSRVSTEIGQPLNPVLALGPGGAAPLLKHRSQRPDNASGHRCADKKGRGLGKIVSIELLLVILKVAGASYLLVGGAKRILRYVRPPAAPGRPPMAPALMRSVPTDVPPSALEFAPVPAPPRRFPVAGVVMIISGLVLAVVSIIAIGRLIDTSSFTLTMPERVQGMGRTEPNAPLRAEMVKFETKLAIRGADQVETAAYGDDAGRTIVLFGATGSFDVEQEVNDLKAIGFTPGPAPAIGGQLMCGAPDNVPTCGWVHEDAVIVVSGPSVGNPTAAGLIVDYVVHKS